MLNILQCPGQPLQQRIIWFKPSIVPRLGKPGLHQSRSHWTLLNSFQVSTAPARSSENPLVDCLIRGTDVDYRGHPPWQPQDWGVGLWVEPAKTREHKRQPHPISTLKRKYSHYSSPYGWQTLCSMCPSSLWILTKRVISERDYIFSSIFQMIQPSLKDIK